MVSIRSAFTLIEVIIAMIIIGITVLTVPMILEVNAKSSEGSLNQEAVYAASATLLQTLSYPWDENVTDAALVAEGADTLAKVVGIAPNASTSPDFAVSAVNDRPGLISRQTRRNGFGQEVNVSNIGSDNANPLVVGIDDFNNRASNTQNQVLTAGAAYAANDMDAAGYKANYNMVTSVQYINDQAGTAGNIVYNANNPFAGNTFVLSNQPAAAGNATNLRMVSVSIWGRDDDNDGNPDLITTLNGYAANIGEVRPNKRRY